MSDVKDISLIELTTGTEGEPEAGYESWKQLKIETTITAKDEGRASYKPLREVAAKYDSDAC